MKKPNKIPCSECPMRRKSLPGYTGSATASELIESMSCGNAMPCHMTVDYDDSDWENSLSGDDVRQCAGQAIFLANTCKLPRPGQTAVVGDSDHDLIFTNKFQFLAHHEGE